MTETAIAAPTPATRLATLLSSTPVAQALTAYKGTLTPEELDAPAAETVALTSTAALHDLGWLSRVEVRGDERFRWLSGMVTNMVNDLAPNAGAWNLVLNAQGRIQGDLTVWREGDNLELEIAACQRERLLAHLDHFIIMDDVELAPIEDITPLGLTGPKAGAVLERLGLPTLAEPMTQTRVEWNGLNLRLVRNYGVLAEHYELWAPVAGLGRLWDFLRTAGASPAGAASLNALRVAEGVPLYGIDMMERDLPQETSQMHALHFNKGCYLGQEIVERIHSRGTVHRHLRQLELSGPLPPSGTELTMEGGAAAGHITSAAELAGRIFALGMIRGEAEIRPQPLNYAAAASGTAQLLAAPPNLNPEPKTQNPEPSGK
jgi:folate-binding protein YgfZ